MPFGKTITGKTFHYSGSLDVGLTIHLAPPTKVRISPEIIQVIRNEIDARSPVLMGANRDPVVANSVGETLLLKYRQSPQVMSYVVPLLIQEGFCRVNDRKPFVIYRR